MIPSPIQRFLSSAGNPFGFDAVDFIVFGLAVLMVAVLLLRERLVAAARKLADRPKLCMVLLAALPIVLRLALLPQLPVPAPRVADDFSYLLLGDTLAHFRLANPTHPFHRFFEGVFVLQVPSYSSIYPLGQGLALAFGQLIFRQPWAGVLFSVGALCALCYWMLRAWTTPAWALIGGLMAVVQFGPLSSWMNTYWGGAVSGIAGCLVFGALPRLKVNTRTRDAVLMGAGLGLQLVTRPYEFVLLVIVVLLFLPLFLLTRRSLAVAALALTPALGLTLLQNHAVTGHWTTLPYQMSRRQYGIPTTFTFQRNPTPHSALSIEQQVDYDAQTNAHKIASESYFAQLGREARFYRFFFPAPLFLVLPAFLLTLRQYRFARVLIALGIFWLGDAFYPFFYPHYIAAETCLFLLVGMVSLQTVSRFSREAVMLILTICLAHFVYGYGFRAGDVIDSSSPGRLTVEERLNPEPGRHLVFIHHSSTRSAGEWVENRADIDASRIVWALDLGPKEDQLLRRYYPDRQAWLLEPDIHPLRLAPFDPPRLTPFDAPALK